MIEPNDIVPGTLKQVALVGAEFNSKVLARALSNALVTGSVMSAMGLSAAETTKSVEELRSAIAQGIQITTPKGDGHDAQRILLAQEKQAIKAEKRLRNAAKGAFG